VRRKGEYWDGGEKPNCENERDMKRENMFRDCNMIE